MGGRGHMGVMKTRIEVIVKLRKKIGVGKGERSRGVI